nr:hypothetical protein DM860_013219 [Ipomoea batatas]
MAMGPERSRPLHNFTLPCELKWGNQKFLRCVKLDSNGEIAAVHRRSNGSSEPPSTAARRTTVKNRRRRRKRRRRKMTTHTPRHRPPLRRRRIETREQFPITNTPKWRRRRRSAVRSERREARESEVRRPARPAGDRGGFHGHSRAQTRPPPQETS